MLNNKNTISETVLSARTICEHFKVTLFFITILYIFARVCHLWIGYV